jgi:ATP-dependent RNA helicase DeaD
MLGIHFPNLTLEKHMQNFSELALAAELQQRLALNEFNTPTPIQAAAIPPALASKDILGSAQTGTGKTLAFSVPLINHLINNPKSKALVLTPTRELALQVIKTVQSLLPKDLMHKSALIIGGDSMFKQLQKLKKRPRVIVGTPGRINDHLDRKTIEFDHTDFLVLDETDRMLDMGFSIQIDSIVAKMPSARQTLLFSATMPKEITKVAAKYLKDPQRIAIGSVTTPSQKIKQTCRFLQDKEKFDALLVEIKQREGSIIVFIKTKIAAERMAIKLNKLELAAEALHGNLRQGKRNRVITSFRKGKFRVLVATDIAARGLDIPHIEHVINYDLPQCPEDYIHRIGRTARAGNSGEALSFVTPNNKRMWQDIDRLINPNSKKKPEVKKSNSKPKKKYRFKKFNKKAAATA